MSSSPRVHRLKSDAFLDHVPRSLVDVAAAATRYAKRGEVPDSEPSAPLYAHKMLAAVRDIAREVTGEIIIDDSPIDAVPPLRVLLLAVRARAKIVLDRAVTFDELHALGTSVDRDVRDPTLASESMVIPASFARQWLAKHGVCGMVPSE